MDAILDSSGIINLNVLFNIERLDKIYVPQSVYDEVKDFLSKIKLKTLNIIIKNPAKEVIDAVKEKLIKYMPLELLSGTDIEVISLAYQLKLPVITEDFDVQNALALLNLRFLNFSNKYIREIRIYKKYCNNCKKYYSNKLSTCPICKSKLKVKIVKSKKLRNNFMHIS